MNLPVTMPVAEPVSADTRDDLTFKHFMAACPLSPTGVLHAVVVSGIPFLVDATLPQGWREAVSARFPALMDRVPETDMVHGDDILRLVHLSVASLFGMTGSESLLAFVTWFNEHVAGRMQNFVFEEAA